MQKVWDKYPKARLHLYNCNDKRSYDTFRTLIDYCKFTNFVRSLQGSVNDVNILLNRVDIVVSGLYPLFARTPIEALAAGKASICMGYNQSEYPWTVKEYSPDAFADTIIDCWENYDKINYRKYAELNHDVLETARQAIQIYEKFL